MKKLVIIALSLATGLAGVAPVYAAPAGPVLQDQTVSNPNIIKVDDDWHHRHGHDWNGDHHRHHHNGNAAAIVGGLAAGAIIGGALASQPRHDVYTRDRYYYNDRPVYRERPAYRDRYYYNDGY